MSQLGRKTPSISGSRASIYSHASTVRTLRTTGGTAGRASSHKPTRLPWWKKPCVSSAFYTDLQRGSWHIGFYTLVCGREYPKQLLKVTHYKKCLCFCSL